MKLKILLTLSLFAIFATANAQDENKNVTITVSGSGQSLDEAKQNALRNAIEQAYGTFISSKTEIFNDQLVADQMSSVSSGNIQSYEMLNESQLPDSSWGVTLKALVSVNKLKSFVESQGITIEIKGGLFALNIKQQLLNERGEIRTVNDMVGLLHEPMQTSFDYVIKSSDPQSVDSESKNWEIPLVVTATANKNMDFCANYFIKTLAAISLSTEEVESYKTLNKKVFPITVSSFKTGSQTFYLRKLESIKAISVFTSQWEFYVRCFKVKSGLDQSIGNGKQKIHNFENLNFSSNREDLYTDGVVIFLTADAADNLVGTFSWKDKRTLAEIEQMTGYSVQPTGVRSQFKHGGLLVYEKDGHGLVASMSDLGEYTWTEAQNACKGLVMNGYSDWYLPTVDELSLLYKILYEKGVRGLRSWYESYWSSTEVDNYNAMTGGLNKGSLEDDYRGSKYGFHKKNKVFVRAVRAF